MRINLKLGEKNLWQEWLSPTWLHLQVAEHSLWKIEHLKIENIYSGIEHLPWKIQSCKMSIFYTDHFCPIKFTQIYLPYLWHVATLKAGLFYGWLSSSQSSQHHHYHYFYEQHQPGIIPRHVSNRAGPSIGGCPLRRAVNRRWTSVSSTGFVPWNISSI